MSSSGLMRESDAAATVSSFLQQLQRSAKVSVLACNFTPGWCGRTTGSECRAPGFYREILNSDSKYYEGSDVGNSGQHAKRETGAHCNDRPYSSSSACPALGRNVFQAAAGLTRVSRLRSPAAKILRNISASELPY